MSTVKQQLEELARKLGASIQVDDTERYWSITVDAPAGFTWNANGCHVICTMQLFNRTGGRDVSRLDAIKKMGYGLCKCEIEYCDYCADNTEVSK